MSMALNFLKSKVLTGEVEFDEYGSGLGRVRAEVTSVAESFYHLYLIRHLGATLRHLPKDYHQNLALLEFLHLSLDCHPSQLFQHIEAMFEELDPEVGPALSFGQLEVPTYSITSNLSVNSKGRWDIKMKIHKNVYRYQAVSSVLYLLDGMQGLFSGEELEPVQEGLKWMVKQYRSGFDYKCRVWKDIPDQAAENFLTS